jgi:hypothetical protein
LRGGERALFPPFVAMDKRGPPAGADYRLSIKDIILILGVMEKLKTIKCINL